MCVCTWGDSKVYVVSKVGKLVASFGGYGHEEGQFYNPSGLVFDADRFLYVCDSSVNSRLQLF